MVLRIDKVFRLLTVPLEPFHRPIQLASVQYAELHRRLCFLEWALSRALSLKNRELKSAVLHSILSQERDGELANIAPCYGHGEGQMILQSKTGYIRLLTTLIATALLSACAAVDQFGSRSTVYNEQTASSKSSGILLNIIRAAYRQPLQFTDISTVTGTASSSTTLGAGIPIQIAGPNLTSPSFMTLSPSATMSGGPQFNVANLNNKEFYQGIQSPLEPQIIANYLNAGVPLKVLLMLYISKIDVDNPVENKRYTLRNSALNHNSYFVFLNAIEELVDQGLSMETISNDKGFGPDLSRREASQPVLLAGLAQSLATASGTGGSSFSLKKSAKKGTYQLSLPGSKPRFCFTSGFLRHSDRSGITMSQLNRIERKPIDVPLSYSNREASVQIHLEREFYCGEKPSAGGGDGIELGSDLHFETRSLEAIIMYLGDMARTQLGLQNGKPEALENPNGNSISSNERYPSPAYLFRVRPGANSREGVTASLQGSSYSVSIDPSGFDSSGVVLQILADLLALKSAAKNLPAPNVISIVQ